MLNGKSYQGARGNCASRWTCRCIDTYPCISRYTYTRIYVQRVYAPVCVGVLCVLTGGVCVGGASSWTSSVGQRRTDSSGSFALFPAFRLSPYLLDRLFRRTMCSDRKVSRRWRSGDASLPRVSSGSSEILRRGPSFLTRAGPFIAYHVLFDSSSPPPYLSASSFFFYSNAIVRTSFLLLHRSWKTSVDRSDVFNEEKSRDLFFPFKSKIKLSVGVPFIGSGLFENRGRVGTSNRMKELLMELISWVAQRTMGRVEYYFLFTGERAHSSSLLRSPPSQANLLS